MLKIIYGGLSGLALTLCGNGVVFKQYMPKQSIPLSNVTNGAVASSEGCKWVTPFPTPSGTTPGIGAAA